MGDSVQVVNKSFQKRQFSLNPQLHRFRIYSHSFSSKAFLMASKAASGTAAGRAQWWSSSFIDQSAWRPMICGSVAQKISETILWISSKFKTPERGQKGRLQWFLGSVWGMIRPALKKSGKASFSHQSAQLPITSISASQWCVSRAVPPK